MEDFTETELFEAFEYLDELRDSGRTNMWLASSYVEDELAWERKAARDACRLWMETFDGKRSLGERVATALERKAA